MAEDNLPSDAEMIDWVQRKGAVVAPHFGGEWNLFAIKGVNGAGRIGSIEERGPSWRAVVEAGMRRMP